MATCRLIILVALPLLLPNSDSPLHQAFWQLSAGLKVGGKILQVASCIHGHGP